MRLAAVVEALAVALLFARSAAADEAPEPIRIEWSADPECPSAEDFWTSVSERTDRARLASDETARVFHVELHKAAARFAGSLRIRDLDGSTSSRDVASVTCAAASEALAFFAALAVDPNAHTRRPVQARPPPEVHERPPPVHEPTVVVHHSPVRQPARLQASVGVGGGIGGLVGLLPSVGIYAPLLLALDTSEQGAWWTPGFRLTVMRASSGSDAAADGRYAISWTVAALDACVVRGQVSILEARLCAAGDVGTLHAESFGVAAPLSSTRPWGAIGGSVRASLQVARPLRVELHAAVVAPLVRDRFFFSGGATVYEVSAVVGQLDLVVLAFIP